MEKETLVENFLEQASKEKWSDDLLKQVSLNHTGNALYYRIFFPEGLKEVLFYIQQQYDRKLIETLEQAQLPSSINVIVENALIIRIIELHKNDTDFYAMRNFFLSPNHIDKVIYSAWKTSDSIWGYLKDTSLDFNYYTKRSFLVAIYLISICCYLSNRDAEKTRSLIKMLLSKLGKISKIKKIMNFTFLSRIPIIRVILSSL